MKIILFQSNIAPIGGVETATYNISKQLSKFHDVLVLYIDGNSNQLDRLKKVVNVERYNKNKIYICDVCICNSSWSGYPDSVVSLKNEYIQIIHANYKELEKTGWIYTKWSKTNRHLAVSNTVRDVFNEMYNENAETMYNILDEINTKKLKFISATRLSHEKGYERMVKFAEMLNDSGIEYEWDVYTDLGLYDVKKYPYFNYKKATLDIFDAIRCADYGIQLSDTEGYSYFVNECLQYGTPMIVTNFDSVYESVIDNINGYILDMDLSNVDLDKIVNEIPKDFDYKPKATIKNWLDLLDKIEVENKGGVISMVKVKIIADYSDLELKKDIKKGDLLTVTLERSEQLVKAGVGRVEEVIVDEEPKKEETKKKGGKNAKK